MIAYQTDAAAPIATGVYACRRRGDHGLLEDIFLLRMDDKWWYLGSDQRCSYEVVAWVGPLQRQIPGVPVYI